MAHCQRSATWVASGAPARAPSSPKMKATGQAEGSRWGAGQLGLEVGSGGGFEGDLVAEGLEFADVVAGLAGGVDAGVVEARAKIVEGGFVVVEQVPDDDEDGTRVGSISAHRTVAWRARSTDHDCRNGMSPCIRLVCRARGPLFEVSRVIGLTDSDILRAGELGGERFPGHLGSYAGSRLSEKSGCGSPISAQISASRSTKSQVSASTSPMIKEREPSRVPVQHHHRQVGCTHTNLLA
jgi:hypothetical protein